LANTAISPDAALRLLSSIHDGHGWTGLDCLGVTIKIVAIYLNDIDRRQPTDWRLLTLHGCISHMPSPFPIQWGMIRRLTAFHFTRLISHPAHWSTIWLVNWLSVIFHSHIQQLQIGLLSKKNYWSNNQW